MSVSPCRLSVLPGLLVRGSLMILLQGPGPDEVSYQEDGTPVGPQGSGCGGGGGGGWGEHVRGGWARGQERGARLVFLLCLVESEPLHTCSWSPRPPPLPHQHPLHHVLCSGRRVRLVLRAGLSDCWEPGAALCEPPQLGPGWGLTREGGHLRPPSPHSCPPARSAAPQKREPLGFGGGLLFGLGTARLRAKLTSTRPLCARHCPPLVSLLQAPLSQQAQTHGPDLAWDCLPGSPDVPGTQDAPRGLPHVPLHLAPGPPRRVPSSPER